MFQIPGVLMVAFLLAGLHYAGLLSVPMAWLLMLGWVIKDAVMFRFVRSAYAPGPPHGTEALVGQVGVVVEACGPDGRVRIGAEHWTARPRDGVTRIETDARVRVVSVEGYTLTVVEENPV